MLELVELRTGRHAVHDRDRQAIGEQRAERDVERLELDLAHRVVEGRDAGASQSRREPRPLAGDPVHDLAELPEDVRPVGAERHRQPMLPDPAASTGCTAAPSANRGT